jgi:hypothetical protein
MQRCKFAVLSYLFAESFKDFAERYEGSAFFIDILTVNFVSNNNYAVSD